MAHQLRCPHDETIQRLAQEEAQNQWYAYKTF
jgi:hypothetical protein